MLLEGKTVVVSGVGTGLGREVAQVALRDGANVVLGSRREENLVAIAGELDPSGERVAWLRTDITDPEQCDALAALGVERFGGVDGLAQVAAFDPPFGGVMDQEAADWNAAFGAIVLGSVQMVKAVAPRMSERGGGSVVLIGAQAMYRPQVPQIAYAAAKGALNSSMYYMATDLGPSRIRVNTVVPTWMWGPPVEGYVSWQAQERGVPAEEIIGDITANMPLGEIPADEDVAEAVGFLLSSRARMITGQSLFVNAGELMP